MSVQAHFHTSFFLLLANNLYGSSQTKPLPVGDYEWLTTEESAEMCAYLAGGGAYAEDADEGYILEVDLEYPEALHESHNSFPLAPERVTVMPEMLSAYAKGIYVNP